MLSKTSTVLLLIDIWVSPSGKATVFDTVFRGFKSRYPNQYYHENSFRYTVIKTVSEYFIKIIISDIKNTDMTSSMQKVKSLLYRPSHKFGILSANASFGATLRLSIGTDRV